MIGKIISPILEECEDMILDYEANEGKKSNYSNLAFRASIKIFMSCMMDKMWELQVGDDMDNEDRMNMAKELGAEIRRMVKTYTGIDSHKLYTNDGG